MIAQQHVAGPLRNELASVIREVNAVHAAAGAPELPDLKTAWISLERNLRVAGASGDEVAARRAIAAYRRDALAAIEEAGR